RHLRRHPPTVPQDQPPVLQRDRPITLDPRMTGKRHMQRVRGSVHPVQARTAAPTGCPVMDLHRTPTRIQLAHTTRPPHHRSLHLIGKPDRVTPFPRRRLRPRLPDHAGAPAGSAPLLTACSLRYFSARARIGAGSVTCSMLTPCSR